MNRLPSIIVTGASSGIGAHCARALKAEGWRVFATARKADDIAALEADGVEAFYLDYREPQSIAKLVEDVLARTGGGLDALGRPKKRAFGAWMMPVFRMLAKLKGLRGTAFDIFGSSPDRKLERELIVSYEKDVATVLGLLSPITLDTAIELLSLPDRIRGYGPVKEKAVQAAKIRYAELTRDLVNPPPTPSRTCARTGRWWSPHLPPSLVERGRLFDALDSAVSGPLTMLVGPAGVGRRQTALALAQAVVDLFADGQPA